MRYEVVEKKGRCFVKRALYPLGVKNVVLSLEREVVLVVSRLAFSPYNATHI